MQFDSLSAFFAMGGHGVYVWLAYGATLLVLAGSYFSVRATRKRLVQELSWMGDDKIAAQKEETKL